MSRANLLHRVQNGAESFSQADPGINFPECKTLSLFTRACQDKNASRASLEALRIRIIPDYDGSLLNHAAYGAYKRARSNWSRSYWALNVLSRPPGPPPGSVSRTNESSDLLRVQESGL